MLKHVSFVTAKPGEVAAFYAKLGGALVKDTTDPDGLRRLVIEFPGGGKLQFFVGAPDQVRPGSSWMEHIAVRVPNLRELADDVRLSPSGNPIAFVLDPDGRHVELLEA